MNLSSASDKPVYRILFFGDTGAGKSYLINKITKKQTAPEFATQKSGTSRVQMYKHENEDSKYELIDTIGFEDNTGKSKCKILTEILLMLQKCLGGVNLFVFCHPVTDPRMKTKSLKDFAVLFGDEVYKNMVIARTKVNQLSSQDKEEYEEKAKDEIIALLEDDPDIGELSEERILFCDSSTEKSFEDSFSHRLLSLAKKTPRYIHSLSQIDFEKLENHKMCFHIPEFNNFIKLCLTDLDHSRLITKQSLERLENKNMENKSEKEKETHKANILKSRKKLEEYEQEFKIFSELEENKQFFIEFATNVRCHREIFIYFFSRESDSLYDDIFNILRSWNESKCKTYKRLDEYEKDLIREIQIKIKPAMQKKISKIIQREIHGILRELSLQIEIQDHKSELIASALLSTSSALLISNAISSMTFVSLNTLFGGIGFVGFIFAALYFKRNYEKITKWNEEEIMKSLAENFCVQIGKDAYEKVYEKANYVLQNSFKSFSQLMSYQRFEQ